MMHAAMIVPGDIPGLLAFGYVWLMLVGHVLMVIFAGIAALRGGGGRVIKSDSTVAAHLIRSALAALVLWWVVNNINVGGM